MPAWGEILAELTPSPDPATGMLRPPDYDGVRHRYLDRLHKLTGRSTVVYYSDWLNNGGPLTPITLKDMAGLMPDHRWTRSCTALVVKLRRPIPSGTFLAGGQGGISGSLRFSLE
jgi:hypothetical protein